MNKTDEGLCPKKLTLAVGDTRQEKEKSDMVNAMKEREKVM